MLGATGPFLGALFIGNKITELLGVNSADYDAKVQATVAGVAVTFTSVIELFDVYFPRRDAKELGAQYFEKTMIAQFENAMSTQQVAVGLGSDLRINIMFVRRSLWFLWLGKTFRWYANFGFDPRKGGKHADVHLWLAWFQGLCGRAYRTGETLFIDLRGSNPPAKWSGLGRNQFLLFWWQLRRTAHVKAVLSIPIFKPRRGAHNPRWSTVGVINIDAVTDPGAAWLAENQKQVSELFLDHGLVLAYLS